VAENRKLLKNHIDDLRRSGLSDDTIKVSRVFSLTDPTAISRHLGWEHPAANLGPCLVFPFLDLAGKETTYYRVRPDRPRVIDGKTAKYESPLGKPNEVYLTPRAREVAADSRVELLFTEGEKKALAADQAGCACVGLVGVWGWGRKEKEGERPELHPDIKAMNLKSRTVYIVYDSDAVYKNNVRAAEWFFALALDAAGANVKVVRIPTKLGGPKVGLDDLLVAAGKQGLARLIAAATEPTMPPRGFSNVARRPKKDKPAEADEIPRPLSEMAAELVGTADGWPRCVAGQLVVPDQGGGTRPVQNHNQLFAYAGSVFEAGGVHWKKGCGFYGREEFYEYLVAECQRFDRVDAIPHHPPIPGVLYTRPTPVPDGKFSALEKLLSFFNPATEVDRQLYLACLLTPLWGGPAGARPGFLFEGPERDTEAGRGIGKTTAVQNVAHLYGGTIDLNPTEPFPKTLTRILTPQAAAHRILFMDNVKTFRLSSAELEGLITSPVINGHRLYKGNACVPNFFTMMFTMNGASLAKDVAQRIIPVMVARPKELRGGYKAEVQAFIVANRNHILADLIGVMKRPPAKLARVSRWGAWEADVLARVENPDKCMEVIRKRTEGMDADAEDADRIRAMFRHITWTKLHMNADDHRFLLTSSALTKLVDLALNVKHSSGSASAHVKSLGMDDLRKSDRKGQRFFLWTGTNWAERFAAATTLAPSPDVVEFDPQAMPDQAWSAGSLRNDAA
jgi:hypothetical protein